MHSTPSPSNLPYSPSWLDRLVQWIDRSPGRTWGFYLTALLALGFMINAAFWIDGSVPFGTIDPYNTFFAVFVVYWIGLYQYLMRVGVWALRGFRPLLEADDAEVAAIQFELSTLPAWLGWLAAALGLAFAILAFLGDPTPYGEIIPNSPVVVVLDIAITTLLSATFFGVLVRSIRQLRMVRRLHARATKINLLGLGPAHAFSSLTARTGIGIILLLVFGYLYDPAQGGDPLSVATYAGCAILAILTFVVPVIGIRGQIEREKELTLDRTTRLLQSTIDTLHQDVARKDFSQAKETEAAIRALSLERDLYAKVSTWPWNPAAFRGFASALLLPLVLWLVTRLLERLF